MNTAFPSRTHSPRLNAGQLVFIIGCGLGLAGCGTTAVEPRLSVYGVLSFPPDAGMIGLTVVRPSPEFSLQLPATKHDASRSVAAAGASDMARDPHGALFFPVGYVLGGFIGGMLGVGEDELRTATVSISTAAREQPVDGRIAQMLLDRLNEDHPGRVRMLADNIPLEPNPTHGSMRRDERNRLIWAKPLPAPHPLAETDVEIVVGLRVTYLGFQARSNPRVRSSGDMEKLNPPLVLVLSADVATVRVRDWADLGGLTISYESAPRKFIEWAGGDGQSLRREMEAGLEEIHRQIIRQFTRRPPSGA